MFTKALTCCGGLLLCASSLLPAAVVPGTVAHFTLPSTTNVPGATLQAGAYSMRVVDHTPDRAVVRMDSIAGNAHATFLAIEHPAAKRGGAEGLSSWDKSPSGTAYLKGWSGKGELLEFVYPKADAVAIAKANNATVPAIDPASEGRVEVYQRLSKEDMELVTLWMLSPTEVSASDATGGIKAVKYQQVASATPHKPVVARLPHTASALPWIWLLSGSALMLATWLRLRRFAVVGRS